MRRRTAELHRRAEQTGIIAQILRGDVNSSAYALYLRNLVPAYTHMEARLSQLPHDHTLAAINCRLLYRASALQQDLQQMAGSNWPTALTALPVSDLYARRVVTAADVAPQLLLAHAYVRYMGDLSGGQILRRSLAASLALKSDALHFHTFPGIDDISSFKARYLDAIDTIGAELSSFDAILDEAEIAFRLNIELSTDVLEYLERS